MKKIKLTPKKDIYNFCEPYIIAEIGANHNGDMALAKKMIKSAKDNGADCVKFQSWTIDSIIAKEEFDRNQSYDDGDGGKKHFGSLKEMVEKYALSREQHIELKKYCDDIEIDFASSPFSKEETAFLNEIGVSFFKVASMDINYTDFLRDMAKYQKPVILSTGMSTLAEIEQAISIFKEEGNNNLILLHCISIYPPKYEDINLRNITMLQQAFNLPVGFSDHTIGTSIPLAAVTLGSCIIEKHFTTDKDLPGWDHDISADPREMREISIESKNIAKSLGSYVRRVSVEEENKKLKFRRSLVVNKDLKKGHFLTENDLTAKRPGTGIPPNQIDFVLNRELKEDIDNDILLQWDNLI